MKVTRIQKEIRDREDLIFQSYQELDKLYPQGIIGLLKKFGVNENETYVFDKHKAKNRGLDDDAYGIAYTSYNEIRYYWETDDDVFPINCTPGDVMVQENIKKLYNYLDQYFGNLILNYFNRVDSLITPHPFGQATLARSPHFGA